MNGTDLHIELTRQPSESLFQVWKGFRHHSRTFSLASLLLPQPIRTPVAVLYMFCRHIDDIADLHALRDGTEQAKVMLNEAEENLKDTSGGDPPNSFLWKQLHVVNTRYRLDFEAMEELIAGARWDLEGATICTIDDLIEYSNLVGGSVGAMMLPLLGATVSEEVERQARSVGIAMQITNILRDVGEDRNRLGRVYIPLALARKHGVDVVTLRTPTGRYIELMETLMQLAEDHYASGISGINHLPRRARMGVGAAIRMYREILNEIRANGYDNVTRRAVVSPARKALVLSTDRYDARRSRLRSRFSPESA